MPSPPYRPLTAWQLWMPWNSYFLEVLSQVPEQATTAFMGVTAPASTPMIWAMAAAQEAPPGMHLLMALPSSTMLLA